MKLNRLLLLLIFISTSIFAALPSKAHIIHKLHPSDPPSLLDEFALSPNNKEIYAVNATKGSLSIIDIASGSIRKILPLSLKYNMVNQIIFSLDGKKAYIADPETIYIVDTNKQEIIGKVSPKAESSFDDPHMALSPVGPYLYVTDGLEETTPPILHIIDTRTDKEIAGIEKKPDGMGDYGWFLPAFAFNHDASLLYMSDLNSSTVDVLNTSTNTLQQNFASHAGIDLIHIALDEANDKLYLLGAVGYLCVDDLKTGKVIKETRLRGDFAYSLKSDGKKLYATFSRDNINNVNVYDTNTLQLIKSIPVGKNPTILRPSSDSTQLYVGNTEDGTISVIDMLTDTVVRQISAN